MFVNFFHLVTFKSIFNYQIRVQHLISSNLMVIMTIFVRNIFVCGSLATKYGDWNVKFRSNKFGSNHFSDPLFFRLCPLITNLQMESL